MSNIWCGSACQKFGDSCSTWLAQFCIKTHETAFVVSHLALSIHFLGRWRQKVSIPNSEPWRMQAHNKDSMCSGTSTLFTYTCCCPIISPSLVLPNLNFFKICPVTAKKKLLEQPIHMQVSPCAFNLGYIRLCSSHWQAIKFQGTTCLSPLDLCCFIFPPTAISTPLTSKGNPFHNQPLMFRCRANEKIPWISHKWEKPFQISI